MEDRRMCKLSGASVRPASASVGETTLCPGVAVRQNAARDRADVGLVLV